MKNIRSRLIKCALAVLLAVNVFGVTAVNAASPVESVACIGGFSNIFRSKGSNATVGATVTQAKDYSNLKLYPGGMPFGVKFLTEGVIVTQISSVKTQGGEKSPAKTAGMLAGDIIIEVNGAPVGDAESLITLAENSNGAPLTVTYLRDGKRANAKITPVKSAEDGKYKTGLCVKDSGAGIGTVTYILPSDMSFGGLGHGICDGQTGRVIPMERGSVVGVAISGVVKGISGTPGEVRGYFSSGKTGTLLKNTEWGVFGVFAAMPSGVVSEPLPVGMRNELKEGKAYIYSTLEGSTPQKYEIEICDIKINSSSNKCFTVKVTDGALLNKSGGIVQGMSGSPIIQNGKLVGAITHVLVNDPTTGYGILIENMLNAAQSPMAKAA